LASSTETGKIVARINVWALTVFYIAYIDLPFYTAEQDLNQLLFCIDQPEVLPPVAGEVK
jgi:hypothetical protein